MKNNGKGNSTLLGAAAEHYVMCQLLRREMIAALAPVGVPNADIIVCDIKGTKLAAIQVKARREIGSDGGWHMKAKHEGITEGRLFYCLVDFGKGLEDPTRCWIVPSKIIARVLTETHEAWFKTPGRDGVPHQKTDMRRLLPDFTRRGVPSYGPDWLKPYKDTWSLISEQLPQISN
jgi:hypothetical protein